MELKKKEIRYLLSEHDAGALGDSELMQELIITCKEYFYQGSKCGCTSRKEHIRTLCRYFWTIRGYS